MNATKNSTIIRNLTATAAMALLGLSPLADSAEAAKAGPTRSGFLSPPVTKLVKPVIEPIQPEPTLITPVPLPFPLDLPVTSQLFSGGKTLRVKGHNTADDVTIAIDDSGANRIYVYDGDDLVASYASSPITKIQLMLKGGDDTFWVGLAPGASHKFNKTIDLTLGSGDDSGFVDFRGSGGNAIVQGSLDIKVGGGQGDDEVFAHFARKHGGTLDFLCLMGGGKDDCSASMWGDITGGADVKFDLKGGGAADNLWSWNTYDQKDGAYSDIRVTSDATFKILMNGGSGPDTLTPTYAGQANGKLTVDVKGSTGSDKSFGVVSLGSSSGKVTAYTKGQAGNDDLRLDVTGSTPFLSAKILGGYGVDTCQSTPNVSKVSCP